MVAQVVAQATPVAGVVVAVVVVAVVVVAVVVVAVVVAQAAPVAGSRWRGRRSLGCGEVRGSGVRVACSWWLPTQSAWSWVLGWSVAWQSIVGAGCRSLRSECTGRGMRPPS